MLLMLFAVGSFWFWMLLVVHFFVLLALIEYEKVGWATLSLGVVFAALYFLGDFNIASAVLQNPLAAALVLGGYFVAGTAWSIAKWYLYVTDLSNKCKELKTEFLQRRDVSSSVIPDSLKKEWRETLSSQFGYSRSPLSLNGSLAPKVSDHKGRIMTWMCYWPWSFVWTMINDPVKKLFRQIYLRIQGLLQSISDRAFRGLEDDLKEPPAPPPSSSSPQGDPDGTVQPRGVRRGGAAGVDTVT